jgi:hypothetical protein
LFWAGFTRGAFRTAWHSLCQFVVRDPSAMHRAFDNVVVRMTHHAFNDVSVRVSHHAFKDVFVRVSHHAFKDVFVRMPREHCWRLAFVAKTSSFTRQYVSGRFRFYAFACKKESG